MKSKLISIAKQTRTGCHAQTTVEFSMILLPFFIIIFGIIDIAQYYFYDDSLQNAMRETAHFTASGSIIPETTTGTNSLGQTTNAIEYYHGVAVDRPINAPSSTNPASRNECSQMFFRSNIILPGITWDSNCFLTSQTNQVPYLPTTTMTTIGSVEIVSLTDSNSVNGPGGIGDYVEIVGTAPVSSITPITDYLTGYSRADKGYMLRCATITKNEPNTLNFSAYPATNNPEY